MLLQTRMGSGRSSGSDHDPVLPPGYRFYPTEEELLGFYLRHRLAGTRAQVEHFIPVVDIYSYHPAQLQAMAGAANVGDKEQWFFFCPRAERELSGGRPARTTPTGYWKATGSPSYVYSAPASRVIGEKRTMVFYEGRAPTGTKTRWKMNEYKAVAADDAPPPAGAPAVRILQLRNEFSVCRVYTSNGTLRSFDRRPLNPPAGGGLDQAAAHRCQQQEALLVPPPPPPASQMAAVDAVAASNGQSSEHSHGSPSSSGSLGVVVDGAEDAAAAIDWDALIPPVDFLRFSVDDLSHVVWPPN
ncbi:NAC domain-containing protein 90-like isoform X2 [Panicum hallii]|uniref:NAC domain-containing protein 90-like isoform X2 n=1 Tax=Panicum hallii TaxID=206008 RepID=UPI000DF4EE60|nr:NAC domain-containing protein 90-like isoform X2 [Panicum hallii]